MKQERIETNKAPLLEVDVCHGDLVIRSWSETAVSLQSDQYQTNKTEAGLKLTSYGSTKRIVPHDASLTIGQVQGDLLVKYLHGDFSLQKGDGDVVLVGLNKAKLGTVNGDLSAKQIDGDISVETVNGDVVCRQVQSVNAGTVNGDISVRFANGATNLQAINGDINLRAISGAVNVKRGNRDLNASQIDGILYLPHIHGDIRLKGPLADGKHIATAQGDIVLRWPAAAPVTINAAAPSIKNRLVLQDAEAENGSLTGHVKHGAAVLNLEANGRIVLKESQLVKDEWERDSGAAYGFDFAFDFADIGERISREVEQNVSRITAEIQSRFSPNFGEEIGEKFARKAEQAAAKAEKAAARAQKRAEQQQSHWPASAPKRAKSPKPKASPEEQIKILKMVEQGIISPEEANDLLQALEA